MSSPTHTTPPPTPTTPVTPSFNIGAPLTRRLHPSSHLFPASARPRSPIRRPHAPSFTTSGRPNLRTRRSPAFLAKLHHISTSLSPLVSLTTGVAHPSFPSSLLQFYLLTSAQLDDLAAYYHQSASSLYSHHYPCPVYTAWDTNASLGDKRRRLGRFMGLRGCESPVLSPEEMVLRSVAEIERDVGQERARRAEREEFESAKGRWM